MRSRISECYQEEQRSGLWPQLLIRQGHADYSAIDFLDDVKCACAREGIQFSDDIFNGLVG
jgi:hypothetical protein